MEDAKARKSRLQRMRRALNKYEKEHEPIVDNASADMDIDDESTPYCRSYSCSSHG